MKEYTIVLESFIVIEAENDEEALSTASQEEIVHDSQFEPRIIERKDENDEVMVYQENIMIATCPNNKDHKRFVTFIIVTWLDGEK